MRGMPRWFNSRQDVENCLLFDREATKEMLLSLLEGRFVWTKVSLLENAESGVTDETHKIVTITNDEGVDEILQYELQDDPTAWLYRIGLTVEEAQKFLEE